jgi:hypothetical protein
MPEKTKKEALSRPLEGAGHFEIVTVIESSLMAEKLAV